jgi:4-amino-4-deoxy-L-arabinose transferase-like glycosyltransferase
VSLRLFNLGGESVWFDEAGTAWMSRLDFANVFSAVKTYDVHPPLWYMIDWLMAHTLGSSEWSLRLPSVVFGSIAVFLLWQIARRVGFDPRTAFVAGILAAIMPGTLYYSQEARMYALFLCAVMGAILAALDERWLWFALCCLVAVYSQNLAVIYIAALGSVVLLVRLVPLVRLPKRSTSVMLIDLFRAVRGPFLALVVVVAIWLPWAPIVVERAATFNQSFWLQAPDIPGLITPFVQLTMGQRAALPLLLGGYVVSFALLIVGVVVSRQWLLQRNGLLVLVVLFVPPAIMAIISWLWHSVYLFRAMIPSAYLIALLWAYLLGHLPRPERRLAAIFLIPMLAAALLAEYRPSQTVRLALRDQLTTALSAWQPGDVVYYGSFRVTVLFGYYWQVPYAVRPDGNDLSMAVPSFGPGQTDPMGFRKADFDQLRALGYTRAWLVVDYNAFSTAAEVREIDRILKDYPNRKLITSQPLPQGTVYLVDLYPTF